MRLDSKSKRKKAREKRRQLLELLRADEPLNRKKLPLEGKTRFLNKRRGGGALKACSLSPYFSLPVSASTTLTRERSWIKSAAVFWSL